MNELVLTDNSSGGPLQLPVASGPKPVTARGARCNWLGTRCGPTI